MHSTPKTTQNAQADAFAAIAHPVRRQILDLLSEEERSVVDLARPFSMSRPAVSQHLKVLLDVGLVTVRKAGREQRYSLRTAPLEEVYDWVGHYTRFWEGKLDELGNYLEENE